MDGLVFLTGIIGNIISVLMFLSPGKTFVRIVKNKSTEEFESLPYICTLLNSSLWTIYGLINPGTYLVATLNGFGVVVQIAYIIFFLIFAPPIRGTGMVVGIMNVGFVAATLLATYLVLGEGERIDGIGLISLGLNIIMYASPLSAMKTVVTTKSVEFMPFLVSFFLCLNGVPNSIGLILGCVQLLLYAIYRNPKPSHKLPPNQASNTHPLLQPSSNC